MKRRGVFFVRRLGGCRFCPDAASGQPAMAQARQFKEGKDFKRLDKPVAPTPCRKVDVIEFFWYSCPTATPSSPRWTPGSGRAQRISPSAACPWRSTPASCPSKSCYYTSKAWAKLEALHARSSAPSTWKSQTRQGRRNPGLGDPAGRGCGQVQWRSTAPSASPTRCVAPRSCRMRTVSKACHPWVWRASTTPTARWPAACRPCCRWLNTWPLRRAKPDELPTLSAKLSQRPADAAFSGVGTIGWLQSLQDSCPMTHRLAPLLVLAALTAFAGMAHAEKADRAKPMNIEADALRHDELNADQRVLGPRGDDQGHHRAARRAAGCAPGRRRLPVRRGHGRGRQTGVLPPKARHRGGAPDEFIEGESEVIEYDGKADNVRFITRAELRRYRGSVLNDEITGAVIVYNNLTDVFTVDGQKAPASGCGRRRPHARWPRARRAGTQDPPPGAAAPPRRPESPAPALRPATPLGGLSERARGEYLVLRPRRPCEYRSDSQVGQPPGGAASGQVPWQPQGRRDVSLVVQKARSWVAGPQRRGQDHFVLHDRGRCAAMRVTSVSTASPWPTCPSIAGRAWGCRTCRKKPIFRKLTVEENVRAVLELQRAMTASRCRATPSKSA